MPENNALKILVCYHKPYTLPNTDDGILLPIHAGKALDDIDFKIQGDNELNGQPCDNISDKHDYYSELTALYWGWKNLRKLYPEVKYVGWYHYRRFFAFDEQLYFKTIIDKPESAIKNYKVNAEKVIKILESGKIILAKKTLFSRPPYQQYCECHYSDDYRTLKKVIHDKFPDYYDAFIQVMESKGIALSFLHLFIMKYDDFVKYCEWNFSVMAAVEPLIPHQFYSPYQKRVLSFLSERLINVYVLKNKMKAEYFNVYCYNSDQAPSENKSALKKFYDYCMRAKTYYKYAFIIWLKNPKFMTLRRLFKKFFKKQ